MCNTGLWKLRGSAWEKLRIAYFTCWNKLCVGGELLRSVEANCSRTLWSHSVSCSDGCFETRNHVGVRSPSLSLCDAVSITLTAGTPDLLLVVLRCFKYIQVQPTSTFMGLSVSTFVPHVSISNRTILTFLPSEKKERNWAPFPK